MNRYLSKHFDGEGGVSQLLTIAFPMMISLACDTVMMFTDRVFLSYLSPSHMSSAMTGGMTAFVFMTFILGITGYGTALVAQYLGAGKSYKCGSVITQGLIISILSYPIIILCIPLGATLFKLTGQSPIQTSLSLDYFKILIIGSVFGALRNCINTFFSGIGHTRVVMFSSMTVTVINVFVSYVLIFGKFGAPTLGIKGAAIGSVFGSFVGLVFVSVAYFLYGLKHREYGIVDGLKYNREIMKKLIRHGTPGGVEFFLNIFAFNILILLLHSYGPDVAAAVTIAFNWDLVSFIPLVGVGIGVNSLTGRFMGMGDHKLAHRTTISGLKIATAYATLMLIIFGIFYSSLVGVFIQGSDGHEIRNYAEFMVRMVAFYVIADGIALVYSGALRGAGDTFWTMVISVISHWFLVVEAILIVRVFHFSPKVSWVIFVFTIPLMASVYYFRYKTGGWRQIVIVDGD